MNLIMKNGIPDLTLTTQGQLIGWIKKSKENRIAYLSWELAYGIPAQIRALRLSRGWTQEEFANRYGCCQAYVSWLEKPGNGLHLKISTLCKIAATYDVALVVNFESWSDHLRRRGFEPPRPFSEDTTFAEMLEVTP